MPSLIRSPLVGTARAMSFPSFLPWLLVFFLSLNSTHLCSASDSITPTQPLSSPRTITSEGGAFDLGFFTPGNSSQRYYIGIWYKQVPERTVVWVANRETPLPNTTNSVLKISEDGNLHLLGHSNVSIWSTNLTSTSFSNSTVAVLLDSGNLVLRDGSNPSVILWQSFDHPTDTCLPGGRIGLNKVQGEKVRLTSWKSKEDPAPGTFSFEIDDNQNEIFMIWNGTQRYWGTGLWDGNAFSGIPEMSLETRTIFRFVDNKTGRYFTYTFSLTFPRSVLDVSGLLKQLIWVKESNQWNLLWYQPSDQCDVYAACGTFGSCNGQDGPVCKCLPGFVPKFQEDWDMGGWSDGCRRRTPLQLDEKSRSNVEKDRFRALPGMTPPASSESFSVESAEECKSACLEKKLCTAYAIEGGRCMIWNGDLINLKQKQSSGDVKSGTLFLRLAASEVQVPISRSRKGMIAGIFVASAIGLAFSLGIVLFLIRRYRGQRQRAMLLALGQGSLVAFSYRNLVLFTKNFTEKLGGGGFGSVFKGTLPDLTMVAVKKLEGFLQGEKQFRAELRTIGTVQHVNLICLRGFCSEGNQKLLVYEYMPNGSLNSHLFGKATCLDWSRRYQIAIGTARGLTYLHEKCRDCIIHCDIKPENILLDDSFCAKIADFGLAKLFGREFSHVLTTIRGTTGYLAPEWISGLAITPKADVYSYGMMLFEIISGRRNREESVKGQTTFFPAWAISKMSEGEVECLLDDRLEGNSNVEEMNRACRVAGWCIQDAEQDRPSMGQIVQILEGVLEVSIPPMPRLFQILDENCNLISSSNPSYAPSNNSSMPSQGKR